jgi:Skp family chaperone for outer membrane proteins
MTNATLSTQTPPEIDAQLATLYGRQAAATIDKMYAAKQNGYQAEELAAAQARLDAVNAEIRPLEDEWLRRGRWSRFFLVTNSGGHIHSTMACTTCFATTQFAWLPALSGLTEADAVEAHGEILCSVCFPSAPVAWTSGVAKTVQADRDARAVAKAARAAKAAEKALLPDGAYLMAGGDRIATLTAAKSWLTDSAQWNGWLASEGRRHPSYTVADELAVAEAVAAKTGETVEAVLAAAQVRAAKRK